MPRSLYFTRLARQANERGAADRGQESIQWMRRAAAKIRGVNVNRMMEETPSRMFSRPSPNNVGQLIQFFYDAKLKDVLPYWDQFPLAMPISFDGDSFLSLNFHYLAPVMRAALFDEMYELAQTDRRGNVTGLDVSYATLRRYARFAPFKPCVKRHLFSHVKSRFFLVPPNDWTKALFLPTARFVGASNAQVWARSRRAIG